MSDRAPRPEAAERIRRPRPLAHQNSTAERSMHIISWIVFGLIVGALARLFVPGPTDFRGCFPTIILGVVGSLVGGFIGRILGMYGDEVKAGGIFMSILGAVIVLVIYHAAF